MSFDLAYFEFVTSFNIVIFATATRAYSFAFGYGEYFIALMALAHSFDVIYLKLASRYSIAIFNSRRPTFIHEARDYPSSFAHGQSDFLYDGEIVLLHEVFKGTDYLNGISKLVHY